MIFGGGISGVQCALDLADSGYKVYLVEKKPAIGGVMAQIDKTFPTNDCAMCIMAPKLVACARHHNVELLVNTQLTAVDGKVGDFHVTLTKKALKVNEEKCTGCGTCALECPVEVIDEYNEGMRRRRAIYITYPQAVPMKYCIDQKACIGCGICQSECRANAIEYDQTDKTINLNVGAIVLSPGFEAFDPTVRPEYGYGRFKNIISRIEFERMLSATGPYGGVPLRPSDGDAPTRIAFIQCVGSRDEKSGNTYCSSYCCMAALKQAVIAKEHLDNLEVHIFFMDTRAFGKGFEEYLHRAEHEHKIIIHRNNRIADISEKKNQDLILRYHEDAEIHEEAFNMAILSVGARPPSESRKLSDILGVQLNEFGFCETDDFTPFDTNVPGIYVCGMFSGPKDIPDSISQASGVAGKISALLKDARNTLTTVPEYPAERDVLGEDPRIGVFVCHCGINIGGIVNVPEVADFAKTLPNVVYATRNMYTCSQDTQEKIKEAIRDHNLNRIVVASCTPRTHESLFQNTIRDAGLNAYLFEMANIRDQCSWVHMKEPREATEKAKSLVEMAVAKSRLLESLSAPKIKIKQAAVVIGGGLSGMTVALRIAESGFETHIVERSDKLGGHLNRIYHTLTGINPQEVLKESKKMISNNDKITVHLSSKIEDMSGYIGNFESHLSDGTHIEHGVTIVATGADEYKPDEYFYGEDKRVIRQTELGEMLAKNKFKAKNVAIIQCVGSRNQDSPNCSRICCFTAMANALEIKKRHPDTNVYILYRDIRTYGFAEKHYNEAARQGVVFVRWDTDMPPEVSKEDGQLVVRVHEKFIDDDIELRPDLIVLNAGIRPNPDNSEIARRLRVPLTNEGYFLEAHMKLRPVDFATDGIFLCGLAHSPRMIGESIAMANGAAARALTILSKPEIEVEGIVSVVDSHKCTGCNTCIEICPYGAILLNDQGIAEVIPAACKGCGCCGASCPENAITMKHYTDEQLLAEAIAAIRGVT
ncbi:MAG: CoB--CoM heterodisulfide reductase iron-sulfur subunit A family protein [Thermoplasmata archaeon]|nr:CoB--CoM heterodisulfide reductase iron-sulfur subunit A family protein [Thermoplasmata archaeon]